MKKIFAVKDNAVQAFGQPFFVRSQGEAIRSFQDETNSTDNNSAIARHPEDYDLYYIGDFDDQTGTLNAEQPTLVIRAKDVKTTGA